VYILIYKRVRLTLAGWSESELHQSGFGAPQMVRPDKEIQIRELA
jgi:hypothetical protein